MSARVERTGSGWWTIAVALATAAVWVATRNIGLALMPMLLLAASWSVMRVSIRWPVAALLFISLLVENPQARPMEDRWRSPLYAAGNVFYSNLNTLSGVELLRFSLFEVLMVALVALLAIRRVAGIGEDGAARVSAGGRWLIRLLGLALATALLLEVWGLARGGDLRQSLWQLRQLVWLPPLAWLCIHAFRRRRDVELVIGIILLSGVVRAFAGFVYYAMSRASGHLPAYVTTHADSMLWMMGVAVCLVAVVEKPHPKTWMLLAFYGPIAGLALLLNDRRLAFVCLGAAILVLLFVVRKEVWRRLKRVLLVTSPVLVIYAVAGWNLEHRIFKPVRTVRSVLDATDNSNHTRDVENFNLVFTALESPLLGIGFGHPYHEHLYTHRIDHVFEQYSFMPHNSVLWLFAAGGILGFLGLWGFLPFVVWFSARCYRRARRLSERVAALGGIAVVVAYVIQAWGDMGVHSWMVTIILAAYVGLVGNLDRQAGVRRLDRPGPRPRVAGSEARLRAAGWGTAC